MSQDKSKPLHHVIMTILEQCYLQTLDTEIAIPYLQGAPGVGKTSIIQHSCNKYNVNLLHICFAQTPIEDISGLPRFKMININGDEVEGTQWTLPEVSTQIFTLANEKNDQGIPKLLIVFLDDFHLCSPAHLELGFEIFTFKSLRGRKFPQNVAFMLAGNASQKAGAKIANSAITNRSCIYPIRPDFEYWKTYFAIPNKINSKVVSFLSNDKYRKYFIGDELTNEPWPSPRSWTRWANLLSAKEQKTKDISHQDILYYCSGHVGEEAASEFTTYYKIYAETEMDKVFNGTKSIYIPGDMSGRYIYVLSAVNKFFELHSSKKDKTFEVMSKILIETAQVSSSFAITGLKEIVLTENSLNKRNIYPKLKQMMMILDPTLTPKITDEIKYIIS